MSHPRPGHPSARRATAYASVAVVAALVAGCTVDPGSSSSSSSPPSSSSPAAGPSPGRAEVGGDAGPVPGPDPADTDPRYALVQQLLDDRAEAVREGDVEDFRAGLATADVAGAAFRSQQLRWFRNLQQLPLGVLSYEVEPQQQPLRLGPPHDVDRAAGTFSPVVTTTMRLRGFDDGPVSRAGVMTVARTPEGYRVVAVDEAGTGDAAIGNAPWDLVDLEVRRQREVGRTLLLLDQESSGSGDRLLPLLRQGTRQVRAAVPFGWSGSVVAYATADDAVIAAVDDVPGGDVAQVGALSFPVYRTTGGDDVASFRFALNPQVLGSDPLYLRRLVTHELTHVALGTRDDGAPTWLSEGVAEHVGARGLSAAETRIAVSVVERAREVRRRLDAGEDVDLRLPPSATFNGPDSDWHYGLGWYAVEWIVAERGAPALWRLLRSAAAGDGTPDAEQGAVLEDVLGVDEEQLVVRAVDLILATYDA